MRKSLRAAGLAALSLALCLPLMAQVVVSPLPAKRGWIGVSFETQTARQGRELHTVTLVSDVLQGSPAFEAGVRPGDIVLLVNGASWEHQMHRLAQELRPGDPVELVVLRDGQRQEIHVTAGDRPEEMTMSAATWTVTLRADSMADRLYKAMDSLRIRISESGDLRVATLAGGGGGDSVFVNVMPRNDMVLRLRGDRDPDQVARLEPFDGPLPQVITGAVVSEVRPPFGFFVFRGEAHDSLRAEMDRLNREIREARLEQAARSRELARAAQGRQATIDTNDATLQRLGGRLDELRTRAAELRRAMEDAARQEALAEREFVFRTPEGTGERGNRMVVDFRPLTPWVLGQNRAAGAEVVDLRPELAEYFQVEGGVLVVDVTPGSPAHTAGIQPGDVLTRVSDRTVRSITDLREGMSESVQEVPVTVVRKGRTLQVLLHR